MTNALPMGFFSELDETWQEIVAAIPAGKLQFREHNIYGNPWSRLPRREVDALVGSRSGQARLQKKKLQEELADVNKEARKLKVRLAALDRRRAELVEEIGG